MVCGELIAPRLQDALTADRSATRLITNVNIWRLLTMQSRETNGELEINQ